MLLSGRYLILILAISLSTPCLAKKPTVSKVLSVAMVQYPPYADKDIKGYGFNARLITAAFAAADKSIEVNYRFMPYQRVINSTNSGKQQAGLFGEFAANKETTKFEQFFIAGPAVFVFNKMNYPQGIAFAEITDLNKFHIETNNGVFWMKMLRDAGLKVTAQANDENIFRKLAADGKKRIDLWAVIDLTGYAVMRKVIAKKPDLELKHFGHTKPFLVNGLSLVFSKTAKDFDPDFFNSAFKKGMKEIVKNGTYAKIARDYYPDGVTLPKLFHDSWK